MPTEPQLPEGVPPLTTYYMYITGGCNLACRHCWITPTYEPNGSTGQCLDFELYKLAIEQALPLGLASIKFTGGEPLLHPDFVRMVDYATERGLRTWLETNGTLMTQELARHLKEKTSLKSVSVSLDGATAATHDYMRNISGSFGLAKRGVEYLAKVGYKPQIVMSLHCDNINEIEELVQWAIKAECGSVKFNIVQSMGRGTQMEQQDRLLRIEQLVELGNWIEKELQPYVSIPLSFSWPMAFHGVGRLLARPSEVCNIHSILGVLSTGSLALCGIGTQEDDLVYGHLGEDSVVDAWTSHPGLLRLRAFIPTEFEGVCGRCIFKRYCLGACVAHNYNESKRLTAPFWFCRLAEEANLFPLSRLRKDASV